MPDHKVKKTVKDPHGNDVILTKDAYRHIQKYHQEVLPWLDTALETVSKPDDVKDYGKDKIYIKELPKFVRSFVQAGVKYCIVPVTEHPEGYLKIKTCFFMTEETYKRKTWKL